MRLPLLVLAALTAGSAPACAPAPAVGAEGAPEGGVTVAHAGAGDLRSLQEGPPGWKEVRGRQLGVAYRGRDSLRAARILRLVEGLGPLAGLPDTLPSGVTLFIAPTAAVFDSLAGGGVPEWSAGVAVPSLARIVIPGAGPTRAQGWSEARVLRHEWAHLGLYQRLGAARAPRWFDEGYAEWASGGWNPTEGWRLRVAFALGRAPPLDSLALDWPRERAAAELAYLLSATAVEYLVAESGERGLRLFLERWSSGRSFASAFQETYGVTQGQFEEDWKRYVKRRYGWLFVLSHSTVFWLTLALALLVMARVRRARKREGMARLRAGEPPDQPAWWAEVEEGTNPPPAWSPEGDAPGDPPPPETGR